MSNDNVENPNSTYLSKYFMGLLWVLIICIVGLVGATGYMAFTKAKAVERIALVQGLQVGMALVMGMTTLAMGFILVWHRITAEYKIGVQGTLSTGNGQLAMLSNSPGLVFVVSGTFLIICAILKPLDYQSSGGWSVGEADQSKLGETLLPVPVTDTLPPEPPDMPRSK